MRCLPWSGRRRCSGNSAFRWAGVRLLEAKARTVGPGVCCGCGTSDAAYRRQFIAPRYCGNCVLPQFSRVRLDTSRTVARCCNCAKAAFILRRRTVDAAAFLLSKVTLSAKGRDGDLDTMG